MKEIGAWLSYYTCVFHVTRPFCWYHKFWPCDIDLNFWPTFEKTKTNVTMVITFEPIEIGPLNFTWCIFYFCSVLAPKILTSWPWLLILSYFWKNLTLAIRDGAFIHLGMDIPFGKTFLSIPKFLICDLDLQLWPNFEKNWFLALTFEPKEIILPLGYS